MAVTTECNKVVQLKREYIISHTHQWSTLPVTELTVVIYSLLLAMSTVGSCDHPIHVIMYNYHIIVCLLHTSSNNIPPSESASSHKLPLL